LPYDIYSVGYPIKPNKKKHTWKTLSPAQGFVWIQSLYNHWRCSVN
jgi:hypothetical protein